MDARNWFDDQAAAASRWMHRQGRGLYYGWQGLDDLSAGEIGNGLLTGGVGAVDALTFGASGRAADALDWQWYDDQRHQPGFDTSRALGVVARDAWLMRGVEQRITSQGFRWAPLEGSEMAETNGETGGILIRQGLEGRALRETLRHEQMHSAWVRSLPKPALTISNRWYRWRGLWTAFEEAGAELYGTGNPVRALLHPFVNGYLEAGPLSLDLGVAGTGGAAAAGAWHWWRGGRDDHPSDWSSRSTSVSMFTPNSTFDRPSPIFDRGTWSTTRLAFGVGSADFSAQLGSLTMSTFGSSRSTNGFNWIGDSNATGRSPFGSSYFDRFEQPALPQPTAAGLAAAERARFSPY